MKLRINENKDLVILRYFCMTPVTVSNCSNLSAASFVLIGEDREKDDENKGKGNKR